MNHSVHLAKTDSSNSPTVCGTVTDCGGTCGGCDQLVILLAVCGATHKGRSGTFAARCVRRIHLGTVVDVASHRSRSATQ